MCQTSNTHRLFTFVKLSLDLIFFFRSNMNFAIALFKNISTLWASTTISNNFYITTSQIKVLEDGTQQIHSPNTVGWSVRIPRSGGRNKAVPNKEIAFNMEFQEARISLRLRALTDCSDLTNEIHSSLRLYIYIFYEIAIAELKF